MAHNEWLDLADLYALGALDAEDLARFERHLSAGCAQCRAHLKATSDALALAAGSLEPLAPPATAKERIFDHIEAEKSGYVFMPADEGQWREMGCGVLAKILHLEPTRQRVTALVRMAPGSRYGDHRHTQTEELLILEGSCYCGGRLLRKGDYHRAEAGSIHLDTRTDEGSLMLVIAAVQNEMLD